MNDHPNPIDVIPSWANQTLWLRCTICSWTEPQDPGGPTLTTLVRQGDRHLAEVHPSHQPEAKRELASQLLRSASTDEGYREDTA
jgi:hypothetical protein